MSEAAAEERWLVTAKGFWALEMSDGLEWPSAEAFAQVAAVVKELEREVRDLRQRVGDLEHDDLEQRLGARIERHVDRLEAGLRRAEQAIDDHEWRQHRG